VIDQSERVAVQCIAERTSQQRHVGAIYQVVDGLTSANRSGETRVVKENHVTTKQTLLERQEPSDQARTIGSGKEQQREWGNLSRNTDAKDSSA